MFSQAPQDESSLEECYTAGLLVRKQLEKAGLGDVADFFNQPAPVMADAPGVTVPRRRARPFTNLEATVVEQEDADFANDLLDLTTVMDSDAAKRRQLNQILLEQLMNGGLR